jgi:hypothetical protein
MPPPHSASAKQSDHAVVINAITYLQAQGSLPCSIFIESPDRLSLEAIGLAQRAEDYRS